MPIPAIAPAGTWFVATTQPATILIRHSHIRNIPPLEKVADTAIKEMGLKLSVSSDSFYKPDQEVITRGHTAK